MTVTERRAILPFQIAIPEEVVKDLRDRLSRIRWPDQVTSAGWKRGVPRDYLEGLVHYWNDSYDWRKQEAGLNGYPQFTTEIDGQNIHFLHVRSPELTALPLVLLHSWPGSIAEFLQMIGPLTDPGNHGGQAGEAFDVVVPSIPGFGFSVPVREAGWTTGRSARAFADLMGRLGYERYGVHGGDIGAGVAAGMNSVDPDRTVGVHVTTDPQSAVSFATFSGDPAENPALSEAEKERVERLKLASTDGLGYLQIQTTRPQTLAYALTDSPVAQLAWIAEKFKEWTDPADELPEDAVELDQLLTNISIYWFTRSGASAAHFLYESMRAQEWSEGGKAPVGWAVFGADPIVRALMDPEREIEYWSEFERGGHFPAMEEPEHLVEDLRRFFAPLR
jgi:pimeloyl-ACP methyl ester carboxylesterase